MKPMMCLPLGFEGEVDQIAVERAIAEFRAARPVLIENGTQAALAVAVTLHRAADPAAAPAHLEAWLAWASRSRLKPFVKLARTLRARRDGVLAAIRLGLSNGRMEGLHAKVRLLSHRSFGFHGPAPLIALIYLCCAHVTINPPLR